MARDNINQIEKRLWDAADELRANSKLKSSEYAIPVLGLIFLRYADQNFASARFPKLLQKSGGANIGQAINEAMRAIEGQNPNLRDALPKTYHRLENSALRNLLKIMASIPLDVEGDAFGKIYEYFLGKFAMAEGQKGGEFFTPTAVVKLIVEILEPFTGRIFDPACGSGGMFVQSARFVAEHRKNPRAEISIYGQERVAETVCLNKMNLAIHGLAGDIRQGNTYYEDWHSSPGKFEFVLANPPFNVDRVDKDRLKYDPRFPFGLPRVDNANYLWIQIFYSALNKKGRAGFVMANSAADARASELEIRKKLIQDRVVDVMMAVGPNMFYTVTLPCMLWFLDKGKAGWPSFTGRERCNPSSPPWRRGDTILFIDARPIFRQVDRAHRDFTPGQIEFLANIVRLYRGNKPENQQGSDSLMAAKFPAQKYVDVPGLCKVATIKEVEAKEWSLNPGRYVGVAEGEEEAFDFQERLGELNRELETLNAAARELEERITANLSALWKKA